MGTSTSYNGPGDTSHLLPSWALNAMPVALPAVFPDVALVSPATADAPTGEPQTPATPGVGPVPVPAAPNPLPAVVPPPPPRSAWRAAKLRMGRVAAGGGGRRAIGRAARAYVGAKGGPRQAARSAKTSRAATVSFGRFLADVVRRGFDEAMRGLGLAQVLDKDAETVFVAILDAIAPEGSRPDEAAARQGMVEALWQLYDSLSVQEGGWAKLETMDAGTVNVALEAAVVECVYSRWIQEVGIGLERKAARAQDAVRRERDMKDYIRESVHLDFQNRDVLAMDWAGEPGRTFVESKYIEAYAIFEGL